MNRLKRSGFTTLECIISLVILSIITYMISFSMNNSFNLLNQNEEHLEMLNLAQNYLNETKNDIKYKNDKINTETIYLNKFQINKIITKAQNYLNEIKYDIKYNEEINIGSQTLNVDNFKINKLIKKNSHYNCYEIVVEVKSIDRSVNIKSYVTKK